MMTSGIVFDTLLIIQYCTAGLCIVVVVVVLVVFYLPGFVFLPQQMLAQLFFFFFFDKTVKSRRRRPVAKVSLYCCCFLFRMASRTQISINQSITPNAKQNQKKTKTPRPVSRSIDRISGIVKICF